MRRYPIFVLLPFCLVLAAQAQDVAMEATLADTVVVTASRQAEDVRETGRRLTVWTAQELARLPVASFDELLRTVGGVEIQSRGGFGVQSDVTMRGASFNGVLVLLDGARLNDPMTGHFLADLPVPLSEIARIEVLRGPASALYGPDAFGGVIQLFTYAGLYAAAPPSAVREGTVHLQRGAYDLLRLDAAGLFGRNGTLFGTAAAYEASDGMPILDAAGRPVAGSRGAVRTDFSRQAYTTAFARAFGGATLYARAGFDDRSFGAYHYYTAFATDTAREATSTYWLQLRLQGRDASRWQLHLAAKQHEDEYVYNPQTPANRHTSRLFTAHAQASRTPLPALTVTGGAAASLRAIDSNNLGVHDDASAGAYAFARYQPLPGLTASGGARLDYDPGYGVEATPQASAAYNRPAFTLRAAAGRAVRAPTYVERYLNTVAPRPTGNRGNPGLAAEHAWSYEGGLDVYPTDGLSLHATAFLRDTRNLIDYTQRTGAETYWLPRNFFDVRTTGVELDAAWHRSFERSRVRLEGSYTRLDTDLGAVEPGVEHKYLFTHARQVLQGAATLDVAGARLGLQSLWKERMDGTSYDVHNVRLGYGFTVGRQRLVASAELRNVFDTAYAEVFDAPMPGRWWLFGLKLAR